MLSISSCYLFLFFIIIDIFHTLSTLPLYRISSRRVQLSKPALSFVFNFNLLTYVFLLCCCVALSAASAVVRLFPFPHHPTMYVCSPHTCDLPLAYCFLTTFTHLRTLRVGCGFASCKLL